MRAAQIKDGVVVNFVEVGGFNGGDLVDPLDAVIGSTWDGARFTAPAPAMPTQAQYVALAQDRLDAFARTRNYDGILSACTYAGSAVPRFAAEGGYAVIARDTTWATCYDLMAQVHDGLMPQPTLEQFDAMLPALEWPA